MAQKLHRAYLIVLELLADRRYHVDPALHLSFSDFCTQYGDTPEDIRSSFLLEISKTETSDTTDIIVLFRETIGSPQIQEIDSILTDYSVSRAIIIYASKITPPAATALKHLRVKKRIIEPFTEDQLQFNVARHEDVPKHILCSANMKNRLLKQYNITKDDIPHIKATDPVCLYYGATKGQIIKIIRTSDSIKEVTNPDGNVEKLYDTTYKLVV